MLAPTGSVVDRIVLTGVESLWAVHADQYDIKDIARIANVSSSTVSRALQNSPLISRDTAEKIQDIAKQSGYRVSAIARGSRNVNWAGGVSNVVVTRVDAYLQGPARPVLWTMLGGALLMVLLACSSVAGLQVFRSALADHHRQWVAVTRALNGVWPGSGALFTAVGEA